MPPLPSRRLSLSITLAAVAVVLAALAAYPHLGAPTGPTGQIRSLTSSKSPVPASAAPPRHATPSSSGALRAASSPGSASGKPIATAPGASGQYPVDAGPSVSSGALTLSPASALAGANVRVSASAWGWLPGQRIALFLGHTLVLTLAGPGATGEVTVPGTADGAGTTVVVSGFQFPGNDEAAPIDAFGTAELRVAG